MLPGWGRDEKQPSGWRSIPHCTQRTVNHGHPVQSLCLPKMTFWLCPPSCRGHPKASRLPTGSYGLRQPYAPLHHSDLSRLKNLDGLLRFSCHARRNAPSLPRSFSCCALSWPSSILRFLSGYMRRLISDAMKQVKATMPLGAPQNRLHIDNIMFFHDARGRWSNRLRGSILYVGIRFPLLQDTGVPVLLTNGLGESLFWPCMRIWRPSSA